MALFGSCQSSCIQKKRNSKQFFGPGNHSHYVASRKDNHKVLDDVNILDDEEGLDEKEPEKAICADKALFMGVPSDKPTLVS